MRYHYTTPVRREYFSNTPPAAQPQSRAAAIQRALNYTT